MSYNTFPISVGQKVWLSPKGNVARGWDEKTLREGVITKIGRKYFYVAFNDRLYFEERFEKESFYNECAGNCNAGYILWESLDAFAVHCKAKAELKEMVKRIELLERDAQNFFSINTKLIHKMYEIFKEEN